MMALFATAFVVGLSGAVMPGPLTAVAIAHTRSHGFWAGPLATLGHGLPEGLLVLLLARGAGGFLARDAVAGTVAVLGAGVLAWMGWRMVQAARREQGVAPPEGGGTSRGGGPAGGHPSLAATAATLSNPYWLLWWATVGAGYVALAQSWGPAGITLFFAGHILADLGWLTLVAAAVARGSRVLTEAGLRRLTGALGLFLLALAGYFLSAGYGFLT